MLPWTHLVHPPMSTWTGGPKHPLATLPLQLLTDRLGTLRAPWVLTHVAQLLKVTLTARPVWPPTARVRPPRTPRRPTRRVTGREWGSRGDAQAVVTDVSVRDVLTPVDAAPEVVAGAQVDVHGTPSTSPRPSVPGRSPLWTSPGAPPEPRVWPVTRRAGSRRRSGTTEKKKKSKLFTKISVKSKYLFTSSFI